MKAYNNDPKFKEQLLELVLENIALGCYIVGTYKEQNYRSVFCGCSVGVTINDVNRLKGTEGYHDNHYFLAEQLGVPVFIINSQELLFEELSDELPQELRTNWTYRLLKAIPVGADLTSVRNKFEKAMNKGDFYPAEYWLNTEESTKRIKAQADLLIKLIKECK